MPENGTWSGEKYGEIYPVMSRLLAMNLSSTPAADLAEIVPNTFDDILAYRDEIARLEKYIGNTRWDTRKFQEYIKDHPLNEAELWQELFSPFSHLDQDRLIYVRKDPFYRVLPDITEVGKGAEHFNFWYQHEDIPPQILTDRLSHFLSSQGLGVNDFVVYIKPFSPIGEHIPGKTRSVNGIPHGHLLVRK